MIRVLTFLAFLTLHCANAQLCVPQEVTNVTLNVDYILHWRASTNCAETQYIVYIHLEDDLQYMYSVQENALDVSFLPACERFYFEVRAFVDNELSDPASLTAYIPAPSGADLTIETFTAYAQDGNTTFLSWRVAEKFAHCARGFRVVIRDPQSPLPRDVYTERNNLFLNNLRPCTRYEFAVMAIYDLQSEGPINLIDYYAPQAISPPPVLENVVPGETYFNITWGLPPYSINSCQIVEIIVDGLPFLHHSFFLQDSPARLPFTISVGGLQPDNMYMLKVYIVNYAGNSEIYPMGVQTLPQIN